MRQHVINQLRNEGLADGWAPEVGERAGYKCEYCDKDMLASLSHYAFSWQHDHIIPRAADGEDTFENLALSCSVCNWIKKAWNPVDVVGENASREELIQATRQHIEASLSSWVENLSRVREVVGWEESGLKERP